MGTSIELGSHQRSLVTNMAYWRGCALAALMLPACGCSLPKEATGFSQPVLPVCATPVNGNVFFGTAANRGAFGFSQALSDVLGKHLETLQEPPLACDGEWEAAYRILWIPALGKDGVTVRASKTGDRFELTAATITRSDDQPEWHLSRRWAREPTPGEWEGLTVTIGRFDLWHRPTTSVEHAAVLDRGITLVEGRVGRIYHVVIPSVDGERDAFSELASEFFKVAQIDPRELR